MRSHGCCWGQGATELCEAQAAQPTSYNELWKSFLKTGEVGGAKDPLPLFSGAGQKLVLQALSTGGF